MQMNAKGAADWAAITKRNVSRAVAIVLDGQVQSAPNIINEITGGNSQISGNFKAEDAKDLAKYCARIPSKVNIIEYNPIDEGEFQQTTPERLNTFFRYLADKGVTVNVRRSRGKDIDAACGQLANKNKSTVPVFKTA